MKDTLWNKKDETSLNAMKDDAVTSPTAGFMGNVNDFFTSRNGIVETAIEECIDELFNMDTDGQLVDAFLLTE